MRRRTLAFWLPVALAAASTADAQSIRVRNGGGVRIQQGGAVLAAHGLEAAGSGPARVDVVDGGVLRFGPSAMLRLGDGVFPGHLQTAGPEVPLITGPVGSGFSFVVSPTGSLATGPLRLQRLDAGGLTLDAGSVIAGNSLSGVEFDLLAPGGTAVRFLHTAGAFTVANCLFNDSDSAAYFNLSTPAGTSPPFLLIDAVAGNAGPRSGAAFENDHGAGSDSNPATSTIRWTAGVAPPAGLAGAPQTSSSILWTWSDLSSNETGFRLRDDAGALAVDDLPPGTTSHLETGLTPNTGYARRVHAFNAVEESGPSNLATASTLLDPPSGIVATPLRWDSIRIQVAPPPNPSDLLTGLRIDRSEDGGASWQFVQDYSPVYDVTDSGRRASFTTLYRFAFRNRAGVTTAFTGPIGVATPALPAPVLSAPPTGAFLRTASPLVAGSSAAQGLTIVLLVDGAPAGAVLSGTDGTWSRVPEPALAEGSRLLSARASDAFGNVSADAAAVPVVVDTIAPTITPGQPAPGGTVTTPTPQISATWTDGAGTGVVPGSASMTVDGVPVAGFSAGPAGISGVSHSLDAGDHSVTVTVLDAAGNPGSATWPFRVELSSPDVTPPSLVLSPADGALVVDATPTLLATYADAGSGVDVGSFRAFLGDTERTAEFAIGPSSASLTLPAPLPDGLYRFRVEIADLDGNATSLESNFRIVSAFGTLGTAGGTLAVVEPGKDLLGASLGVPAGALAADRVFILSSPSAVPPLTGGWTAVGPAARLEPAGTSFSSPATLRLKYSESQVLAGGSSEADVRLLRYEAGSWVETSGSSVDATGDAVSAPLPSISSELWIPAVFRAPTGTTVVALPDVLPADGVTYSRLVVTPRDGAGNLMGPALGVGIRFVSGEAELGPLIDEGDGTYAGMLRSTTPGVVVLQAQLDGADLGPAVAVTFTAPESLPATLAITEVSDPLVAGTASGVVVTARDSHGFVMKRFLGTVRLQLTGARRPDGQPAFAEEIFLSFDDLAQGSLRLSNVLRFATAGEQSVTASLVDAPGVSTVLAGISVLPGPAASIVAAAGDGQTAPYGQPLPRQFEARVDDAFGNPVPGHDVTFAVVLGGGTFPSASSAGAATGADGVAVAPAFTLGPAVGSNVVRAEAGGAVPPAAFTCLATRPPPVVSQPPSASLVDGPTFTISGNALEEGLAIQVFLEGVLVGTTTTGPGGDWSLEVLVVAPTASLTVVAVDAAGIVSIPAELLLQIQDVQGPALSLRVNDRPVFATSPGFVNDASPLIRVRYADASPVDLGTLQIALDGVDVLSQFTVSPGEAVFQVPDASPLLEGARRLSVSVEDVDGHLSVAEFTVVVDVAPAGIRLAPRAGSVVRSFTPVLRAEFIDAKRTVVPPGGVPELALPSGVDPASVRILVEGRDRTAQAVIDPNQAVLTIPAEDPVAPGLLRISIELNDRAGNPSVYLGSLHVNPDAVDGLAPTLQVIHPGSTFFAAEVATTPFQVAVRATDNFGVDRVELFRMDPALGAVLEETDFVEPYTFLLPDGAVTGTYRVVATDASGNATAQNLTVQSFPTGVQSGSNRPDWISVQTSPTLTAGEPFDVTVVLYRADGTPFTGYNGIVSLGSSDPTSGIQNVWFFMGGAAVRTVQVPGFRVAGHQVVRAELDLGSAINGAMTDIFVDPGLPVSIDLAPLEGTRPQFRAGASVRLQIAAKDAFGNSVPDVVVDLESRQTDAAGAVTTTRFTGLTGSPAVATVPLASGTRHVALTASAPEHPGAGEDTLASDVATRYRINVVFHSPAVEAGGAVSFSVYVLDENGNPVPDFEGTVYVYAVGPEEEDVQGFPLAVEFSAGDRGVRHVTDGAVFLGTGLYRFAASTEDLGAPVVDEDDAILLLANGISNQLTVVATDRGEGEILFLGVSTSDRRPMTVVRVLDIFENVIPHAEVRVTITTSTEDGSGGQTAPSPALEFKGRTGFDGTLTLKADSIELQKTTLVAELFGLEEGAEALDSETYVWDPFIAGADSLTVELDAEEDPAILTAGVLTPAPEGSPPGTEPTLEPQDVNSLEVEFNLEGFASNGRISETLSLILNPDLFQTLEDLDRTSQTFGFKDAGADIQVVSTGVHVTGDGIPPQDLPVTITRVPGSSPNSSFYDVVVGGIVRDDGSPYSGRLTWSTVDPIRLESIQVEVPPNTPEIFEFIPDSKILIKVQIESATRWPKVGFLEGTWARRQIMPRDMGTLHQPHDLIVNRIEQWSNYGEAVVFEIRTDKDLPTPEGEQVPTVAGVRLDALEQDPNDPDGFVTISVRDEFGDPVLGPGGETTQAPGTSLSDLRFRRVQEGVYRSDPVVLLNHPLKPPHSAKRATGSFTLRAQSPVLADERSSGRLSAVARDSTGFPIAGATVAFSSADSDVKFLPAGVSQPVSGPVEVQTDVAGSAFVDVVCKLEGTRPVQAVLSSLPGGVVLDDPPTELGSVLFYRGPVGLVGALKGRVRITVPGSQSPPPPAEGEEPPPDVDVFKNPGAPMTTDLQHTRVHGVRILFAEAPPPDDRPDPTFDPEAWIEAPAVLRGRARRFESTTGSGDVHSVVSPPRIRWVFSDIKEFAFDLDGDGTYEPEEIFFPEFAVSDGFLESSAEFSADRTYWRDRVRPNIKVFPLVQTPQHEEEVKDDDGLTTLRILEEDKNVLEWEIPKKVFEGEDDGKLYKNLPTFLPGPNQVKVFFHDYYGNRGPNVASLNVVFYAAQLPSVGPQIESGDPTFTPDGQDPQFLDRFVLIVPQGLGAAELAEFLRNRGLLPLAWDSTSRRLTVRTAQGNLSPEQMIALQESLDAAGAYAAVSPLGRIAELQRTAVNPRDLPDGAARAVESGPSVQEAPRGTTPFGGGAGTVNLHNGELVVVHEDLRIPGTGMDWHHTRTYRSQVAYDGPQGHNWDFNYNLRLGEHYPLDHVRSPSHPGQDEPEPNLEFNGDVVFFDGAGRREVYVYDPILRGQGKGGYFAPPGRYDRLHKKPFRALAGEEEEIFELRSPGSPEHADYVLVDRHRTKFKFVVLPDARTNPELDLNAPANPLTNHGAFARFAWIWEIEDRNGNRMAFRYNTDDQGQPRNESRFNRLTSVIDTSGREIAYRYNLDGTLNQVQAYAGSGAGGVNGIRTLDFTYYFDGEAGGGKRDLKLARSPRVQGTPNGNDFPQGKLTTYTYLTSGGESLRHNLASVTDGAGNAFTASFDGTRAFLRVQYGVDPLSLEFDRVVQQTYGRTDGGSPFSDTSGNFTFHYGSVDGSGRGQATTTEFDRLNGKEDWIFSGPVVNADHTSFTTAGAATPVSQRRFAPDVAPSVVTTFAHSRDTELLFVAHPLGNTAEFEFDLDDRFSGSLGYPGDGFKRGNLRQETRDPGPRGSVSGVLVTEFEYDAKFNFVEKIVRPRGAASGSKAAYTTSFTIDASTGNVTAIHEPAVALGAALAGQNPAAAPVHTELAYGAGGRLDSRRNPDGSVDKFGYDGAGYLNEVVRDFGRLNFTTSFLNDAVGNVIRTTDPRGATTTFDVNALNQVVRTVRAATSGTGAPVPPVTTLTFYDANDNVVEVRQDNPFPSLGPNADYSISFAEQSGGLALNFVTRHVYDGLNNVLSSTQDGVVTGYRYDANENRVRVVPPVGEHVVTDHNSLDLPSVVTRGGSSFRFLYDAHGNRTVSFDGNDARTDFVYDGHDRNVEVRDPGGNVAALVHDAHGNVRKTTLTGPDGHGGVGTLRVTWQYFDNLDRLYRSAQALLDPNSSAKQSNREQLGGAADDFKEVPAGVAVAVSTLDAMGRPVASANDNGNVVRQRYDTAGRLDQTIDAAGRETLYTPDANGNVVQIRQTEEDGIYFTTQDFDALNRLVYVRDPGNVERFFFHDSRDLLVSAVDGRGNRTNFYYDAHGRRTGTQVLWHPTATEGVGTAVSGDGTGIFTKTAYDDNGNVVSQTDANGTVTAHFFDSQDRRTDTIHAHGTALASAESFGSFDGNGQPRSYTDRRGVQFALDYDALGRVTSMAGSPPAGLPPNRTIEGTTSRTMAWDGLGRLTYASDNPDFHRAELFYNGLGQVVRDVQTHGVSAVQSVSCSYDGVGNKVRSVYPSGKEVTRFYHPDEQLRTVRAGNVIGDLAVDYQYAGPGRVFEKTLGDGTVQSVFYDDNRRMESSFHTRFGGLLLSDTVTSRDREGNLTARLVRNRLVADNVLTRSFASFDEAFAYDAAGRMTSSTRTPKTMLGGATGIPPAVTSNAFDLAGNSLTSHSSSATLDQDLNPVWIDREEIRTVDGLHRYTQIRHNDTWQEAAFSVSAGRTDAEALQYDGTGNLVETPQLEIRYDVFNRPVRVLRKTKPGSLQYMPRRLADGTFLESPDVHVAGAGQLRISEPRSDLDPSGWVGGWVRLTYYDTQTGLTHRPSYEIVSNTDASLIISEVPFNASVLAFADQEDTKFWSSRYEIIPPGSQRPEIARYAYDGLGRRTTKQVFRSGVSNALHRYSYEGFQLVEDRVDYNPFNSRPEGVLEVVWGRSMEEPVRLDNFNIEVQGSTQYLFHGPSGELYASDDRSPTGFDDVLYDSSPTGQVTVRYRQGGIVPLHPFLNPVAWQGHTLDFETGLTYARARYYSPALGRFIQADPMGAFFDPLSHGNPYTYGAANPASFRDDGHAAVNLVAAGVGGLIGGVMGYLQTGTLEGTLAGIGIGGLAGLTFGASLAVAGTGAAGYAVAGATSGFVAGALSGGIAGLEEGGWSGAAVGAIRSGLIGGATGAVGGFLGGTGSLLTRFLTSIGAGTALSGASGFVDSLLQGHGLKESFDNAIESGKWGAIGGALGFGAARGMRFLRGRQVQANRRVGGTARDFIAQREGTDLIEQVYTTKGGKGKRILDVFKAAQRHSFESKVGRQSLDADIRQQLIGDIELLRSNRVAEVTWEFFRSAKTGQIGPTKPLERLLLRLGRRYNINLRITDISF